MSKYKNLILYSSIILFLTQSQSQSIQRQPKKNLIILKNNLNIGPLIEKFIKNLNFTNKMNNMLKELADSKNNDIQIDLSSIKYQKKLTNLVSVDAKLIGIKNLFFNSIDFENTNLKLFDQKGTSVLKASLKDGCIVLSDIVIEVLGKKLNLDIDYIIDILDIKVDISISAKHKSNNSFLFSDKFDLKILNYNAYFTTKTKSLLLNWICNIVSPFLKLEENARNECYNELLNDMHKYFISKTKTELENKLSFIIKKNIDEMFENINFNNQEEEEDHIVEDHIVEDHNQQAVEGHNQEVEEDPEAPSY